MKTIQQWLDFELLNYISNKFCLHSTTDRLLSMTKIILVQKKLTQT